MGIASQVRVDPRKDGAPARGDGAAFWGRTAYTYASLIPFGAATSATFTFPGAPWGTMIHGAFARLIQNFAGVGAVTFSLVVPAGINIISAVSVAAGAPSTLTGQIINPTVVAPNTNGAMVVTFSAATALSGATAGKLELFALMSVVELQS